MPLTLRLDPWAAEYETAFAFDQPEEKAEVGVREDVETADWALIQPEYVQPPETTVFVDGVERVETRVAGNENGRPVFGGFVSIGVGAVISGDARARIEASLPLRIIALSNAASSAPWPVECGKATLVFEPRSAPGAAFDAWHEAVGETRRNQEVLVGMKMAEAGHPLVVVDGRLGFQPRSRGMAVGLVKSLLREYLSPARAALLPRLPAGARSPVFLIEYEHPVYSWYLRLADGRRIDHALAGVVRLETMASVGIEAACRLADLTAAHLPRFASSRQWDARAPQNLYPISALEERLRHELGDREWIRRHIEAQFYRQFGSGVTPPEEMEL